MSCGEALFIKKKKGIGNITAIYLPSGRVWAPEWFVFFFFFKYCKYKYRPPNGLYVYIYYGDVTLFDAAWWRGHKRLRALTVNAFCARAQNILYKLV